MSGDGSGGLAKGKTGLPGQDVRLDVRLGSAGTLTGRARRQRQLARRAKAISRRRRIAKIARTEAIPAATAIPPASIQCRNREEMRTGKRARARSFRRTPKARTARRWRERRREVFDEHASGNHLRQRRGGEQRSDEECQPGREPIVAKQRNIRYAIVPNITRFSSRAAYSPPITATAAVAEIGAHRHESPDVLVVVEGIDVIVGEVQCDRQMHGESIAAGFRLPDKDPLRQERVEKHA